VVLKQLVDFQAQMIPFVQCLNKIAKNLEQKTKSKFAKDGTMCKDKWNSLNSIYTKIIDYHKGIKNHTYFWDLSFNKKEIFIYHVNLIKSSMN
jgi:hypothetical protein